MRGEVLCGHHKTPNTLSIQGEMRDVREILYLLEFHNRSINLRLLAS